MDRPPRHERTSATSEGELFSAEDESEAAIDGKKLKSMTSTSKLNPLELEMDPTVSWVYRPAVLSFLGLAVGSIILFAYHSENLVVPAKVEMLSAVTPRISRI